MYQAEPAEAFSQLLASLMLVVRLLILQKHHASAVLVLSFGQERIDSW